MKVFFLDDDITRRRAAMVKFARHQLTMAANAKDAIEILDRESPFDLVHLDHDLGGVYLPSDEKSGYAVAVHVANLDPKKRPNTVVVHSYNPEGAKKMISALRPFIKNVYYSPFDVNDFSISI